MNQSHSQEQIAILQSGIYSNFCCLAIALHCIGNSQNWQIMQKGPAYNQCEIWWQSSESCMPVSVRAEPL